MSTRRICLVLIVGPGDAEALERLMEELKRLEDHRGERDEQSTEPSCN
ncbi:MAG: hypothetical protein HY599_00200 [Candidatus Omnitrophica bacterium]|nr:hypothetical protein [Candidatus Omnitrophota bacterium]